jgi:hypothetical protein
MSIAHARTPQLGIYSAVAELKQVIRASRYLDRATNTTLRKNGNRGHHRAQQRSGAPVLADLAV